MSTKELIGALFGVALLLLPASSQARWMNANMGRFQTTDPYEGNQEDPQSLHKYVFTRDDPVNLSDPSGRLCDFSSLLSSGLAQNLGQAAEALGAQAGKSYITKQAATIIALVTVTTVGALLLNGDDPSVELNSDRRLNPTCSPHAYQNFQCTQFANDATAYFVGKKREPERITYDNILGKTYNDFITAVEHFGVFGGETISMNGHHEGVLVDGQVYDNNVPFGVPRVMWENGYLVIPKTNPDQVLTLRQAHNRGCGILSPP
jgi:hypothetical protein